MIVQLNIYRINRINDCMQLNIYRNDWMQLNIYRINRIMIVCS